MFRASLRSTWLAAGVTSITVAGFCSSVKPAHGFTVSAAQPINLLDLDSLRKKVSEDQELTWGKVSNRAALELSNFTCNFVDVTFNRWMECEDLYHKYLEILLDIMEEFTKVIGTPAADDLWSSLMFVKGYLAEVKEERQHIQLLWNNCRDIAASVGQAAYSTGAADSSGYRLGQLMAAAESNISRMSSKTRSLELRLSEAEAGEIRKSSKHQKNAEKK
ncbi:hypothetical protein EB796_008598 [Bugula neritina]|uniref:Uncharacterized protein n=1 Tax=Bugula neritina TaxID=10212 RepID=A0A7J7K684_BUGNE|nr:hypothetical protein EB796_008598 [Bugula neritina]